MSSEIQYEDFEIEVRSIGKRRYEVRVLRSFLGRAGSRFTPPYPAEKLDGILSALEGRVCASARAARDLVPEQSLERMTDLEVEELGRRLFKALFPRPVERRFREALSALGERSRNRGNWGLRVRVTFDQAQDFALLATLPWEFLWDNGTFINRRRHTPVVRCMTAEVRPIPAMTGPLRVLLIPSNPKDGPSLDIRREARLIRQALRQNPDIELVTMRPKIEQLATLADKTFDIVHFMGHGGIPNGEHEEFVLYFEGKDHRSQALGSSQLTDYLRAIHGLRLVVLNSCWSGALPRRRGQDPFSGVGAALIASGVPAVVAMQFPVSDEAAIAFSRAFYERLVAKDFIAAAATMGRLAILEQEKDSLEWATPVVFLGGQDFYFGMRPGGEEQPPTPPTKRGTRKRPESSVPLRLAIQSFKDPYLSDTQAPDAILDLTSSFKSRYIRDASLWREEVYPRLAEFLVPYAKERTPIILDLAAHLTIAFAAGYCLEAKSGLDVTVLQRTQRGVFRWKAEQGPVREGPLWQVEEDLRLPSKSPAVAVAISATLPIVADVEAYLQKSHRAIGRLMPVTIFPNPGSTMVKDGQHALQLAQDVSLKIHQRSTEERGKPLHLFAAAPNALLFFLGQLARSFGRVQLYEHDFPSGKLGAYLPSLQLPVP